MTADPTPTAVEALIAEVAHHVAMERACAMGGDSATTGLILRLRNALRDQALQLHRGGGDGGLEPVSHSLRSVPPDQVPETADPELTEYVTATANKYRAAVNGQPGLLSLLYDVDLLPEQLLHVLEVNPPAAGPNAARLTAICELWAMANKPAFQQALSRRTTEGRSEPISSTPPSDVEASRQSGGEG